MQSIMPMKLKRLSDEFPCAASLGMWLSLRCSNELHRPMRKTSKPSLKMHSIVDMGSEGNGIKSCLHAVGEHHAKGEVFNETIHSIQLRLQSMRVRSMR